MAAQPQRKRKKWDVAAPEGVPIGQADSVAAAAAVAAPAPAENGVKAGQPPDAAAIARAQQSAAAVMAKINKVGASICVTLSLPALLRAG